MYGNYYTYKDVFECLDAYDQLEIWRWITGHPLLQINEFITSPFRVSDKHPGCYIRRRGNILLFTDFTDHGRFNKYTICHAVARLHNCNLNEAATIIVNKHKYKIDIPLTIHKVASNGVIKQENETVIIDFEPYLHNGKPTWLNVDKRYWESRGISRSILEQPHQPVYSVYCYYVNGQVFYPETLPCFAYTFPSTNHVKIYEPNADKRRRFRVSTTVVEDVWEWHNFPPTEICILTKSYKDGVIVHTIFPHIDIYAFQNEGCIPVQKIESMNSLHDKVIILYDNDLAGIRAAWRLVEEFKVSQPVFYPTKWGKDTDDVLLYGGRELIKSFLEQYILL